jgi:hypothetical protein
MNRIAQAPPSTSPDSVQAEEALRRVIQDQIGPREPGVVYYDGGRLVEVRRVINAASEARRILRRRAAQFAILVRDLHTGTEHYTGAIWTGSDRVLKTVTL